MVKVTADTVIHKDYSKCQPVAEICLIKVGGLHYIHPLLRLPRSIKANGRVEGVKGALIIMLICIWATVRQTITDQQDAGVAEGFS